MNSRYTELEWLPRAPQEFSARLKSLGNSVGPLGRELQSLSANSLDLSQLTKLANFIDKARSQGKSLEPWTPFRLAVLSNSTIEVIVPALLASGARRERTNDNRRTQH
jgi:hypothetical protein